MDAFVAPIVVAVGSALAWFAYQHPRDYGKLVWWLILLCMLFAFGGLIWTISNDWTDMAAVDVPSLTGAQIGQLAAAMNAVRLPWWWYPATIAVLVYLGFLSSFPGWISDVGNRYRTAELDPKTELDPKKE